MKKRLLADFDLLIVDADGTVAPHLAVGLANEIARRAVLKMIYSRHRAKREVLSTSQNFVSVVKYVFKHVPKFSHRLKDYCDVVTILLYGFKFHVIRSINNILNSFNLPTTNKLLINGVVNVFKNFDFMSVMYTKKDIEKVLYPGVKDLIKSAGSAKKVMVSEDFVIHGEERHLTGYFKDLLGLNEIVSNDVFVGKKGVTSKIRIKDKHDKCNAAKDVIKRYKAKKVAFMCNDFEDVEIANLPQVKLVIANNPPHRLRKVADYIVDNDYTSLI